MYLIFSPNDGLHLCASIFSIRVLLAEPPSLPLVVKRGVSHDNCLMLLRDLGFTAACYFNLPTESKACIFYPLAFLYTFFSFSFISPSKSLLSDVLAESESIRTEYINSFFFFLKKKNRE